MSTEEAEPVPLPLGRAHQGLGSAYPLPVPVLSLQVADHHALSLRSWGWCDAEAEVGNTLSSFLRANAVLKKAR